MAQKVVVQVFCTGMGWVDSKYSADTADEACELEVALLLDDSAWVDPQAKRQTRLMPKEVCTSA